MGIFGRDKKLVHYYQLERNEKVAEKFYLGEAGNVTKIMVYGQLWGDPYYARCGIYDDVDGEPKNLLGETTSITSTNPADWIEFPFPTPISLNPGWYWLTIHAKEGFNVCAHYWYETMIEDYHRKRLRRKKYDDYADGLEPVWTNGEVFIWILSIYAVYQT